MKVNKEQLLESKAVKFVQKYWLYIVVVLSIIIVALSSINIYKEEVLEIEPNVKKEKQSSLFFASASFDTLNPIISKSADTYYVSKLMYDSLFEYTDTLNVQGELVQSYEVDTEKAYVDITLKPNIKWHNGKEFTAQDVKFTVNAIKSYGGAGVYYENGSKIRSVTVKDDLNLRIYFNNNYQCSLDDLTFPILPRSEYSSVSKLISTKDGFEPVGTGQYKFSAYDSVKELSIVPNESYWGAKAQNTIAVRILPDKSWASNMMEFNSVTCYTDTGSERKSLVEDKGLTMYDMISNDSEFIVFNTDSPATKDKMVRRGICRAIDRKEVLQNGYMEDAVLSDTVYYPGFLGVADDENTHPFDRDQAEKLLAKAGYEDRDLNGKIENEEGENISLTILVNNDNANRIAAARIIEKNLEHIGFTVSVVSVPWDEYTSFIAKKEFDILLTGYEMEANYDLRSFFDGKAPWKYTNNELLEKARELDRLHSAEEYTEIFKELKEMMIDDSVYYPLVYKKMGLIGIDTFEAGTLPMFNDIYKNCYTWSWSKKTEE